MNRATRRIVRIVLVVMLVATTASCEPPAVYGSIGYSSYGGGGYHGGYGGSIRVGGRIL